MPTVSNGQTLDITAGQSVSGILVLGGGALVVHSGASVSGTTLDTQALEVIDVGGADSGTVVDGGSEVDYGTSTDATVDAGTQVVYGATTGTVLTGTGIQQLFTGGTASGTVVGGAGAGQGNLWPEQNVGLGGTSVGTIVNAGGVQNVQSTGIAHDTTVNSGGNEIVNNGGTAVDATMLSGGNLNVYDGTLSGSMVDNGTLTFWAGNNFSGQLSGTGSVVVGDGTLLLSSANNFAGNISINGNTLELGATGAAGSATIGFDGSPGTLQIDGTSMPSNTIHGFALGDLIDLAGISFDPAGTVQLAAGNVLQITEAGHLYQLQLDPSASFAGMNFGIFADAASGTYVTLGQQPISDTLTISSGQSANDILVLDGGTLHVLSGGVASATMIDAGGSDLIDIGGSVTGTTINGAAGTASPGAETVLGSASGTTVLNGGFQDVYGTANNTTVSGEISAQDIESGGLATGTTIDGGGSVDGSYQIVLAGGVAAATIVDRGGDQIVQAGGVANGTVVTSGGLEEVYAGGTTNNTTIDGGTLQLDAGPDGGGIAGGTITFLGTGGTLYIGDPTTFGATIDSLSQGNIICFDGTFNSNSTVQLLAGNVLQVIANSVTYDLQLDPNASFSGESFKIGSDGPTGTEVYLEATPAPTTDPPAPTVADIVLNPGQTSVAASTLFTASDPDGDTIATYGFEDTGSGNFVLNGVAQANNQEIDVTAAQLSQLTYQGVAGAEPDTIQVRVDDGTSWSNWAGFTVTAPPLVIESYGSTSLVELGGNYYLDNNGSGTGPELKSGGVAVVAGQYVDWTPIGTEQTASGYEVAWHNTFTGNYQVWTTDSSGNYIATLSGSLALESLEPSFHQDLNGDGVIGIVSTTIQTDGSTSLVQVGNNYYLDDASSGTGPSLKFEGEEYVAGDPTDSWTPIGAVQTATGYDVALKWGNYYSISTTDSNGNFISFAQNQLQGSSIALESWETTFNQDLNGDGTIGVVSTTIQTDGSTSLVEACGSLYFDAVGSGVATGPSLKYGGFDFTVDQTTWVPIGAVQTATGYQIAWELPGADKYMVWNIDSNGNYVSNAFSASNIWANVSGSSVALESLEASFHQDLNGDGVTGIPAGTALIQTDGSTSLIQTGNHYYLQSSSTATGPALQFGSTPVVVGQAAPWTPIGAVQTATGYDVAWHEAGTNEYSIWSTDSSGKFVSFLTGAVSGSSAFLESYESIFGQDLNSDGVTGIPTGTTLIQTDGSTSLIQTGNNYYLQSTSTATGPELQFGGAPVVAGQAAPWTPIGAVQTATGYDVAWHEAGTDQYSIWSTDSSGNFVSFLTGAVSGTSTTLESYEPIFHQDLNGDGAIGTPIEMSGSTSLIQVGTNYYMDTGGAGPGLKFGGAPVVVGQSAPWTPIGAEQTSTGYDVAWHEAGTDQYSIWSADSNGNFLSFLTGAVSGTSSTLESYEAIFDQDLNGDGVIDLPTTVIEAKGDTLLTLSPLTQPASIDAGATLELAGANSSYVAFNGPTGTLILDQSTEFSGQIVGFTGDGSLSGSDQLDLRDIAFGPGTTVDYSGTPVDGVLTVSDAENHTAHITLAGDYTSSTFTLSSDGNGGTTVIDPVVTQDTADGTLSFSDPDSTDTHGVSVSPQNGDTGYLGSFVADAVNAANGQDTVGWHFNLASGPVPQTVTQSYDVSVADHHADGTTSTASQLISVTIAGPGNDAFVFRPGVGAETIVNAGPSDTIELDGFRRSPATTSWQRF